MSLVAALLPFFPMAAAAQTDVIRAQTEGMNAYRERNWGVAIERLASVYNSTRSNPAPNLLYTLGFAYFFEGRFQEAADVFQVYVQRFPESPDLQEVQLILGRSLLQIDGKAEEALAHLARAATKPEFADEARFMAADAYIKKGDIERAAQTLKTAMEGRSSGTGLMRAAIQLVDLYIDAGKLDEALKLMEDLEKSPSYPDVIVVVNNRLVKIGDLHLDDSEYKAALKAYSSVRPRHQVISIQTDRLEQMKTLKADLDKRIEAATRSKQPLPRNAEEHAAILAGMIENTGQVLGELRTADSYDATIQYRIGRCYFNMERFWPAAVAFEVVADENPTSPDASTSLFGAVVSQWRLERFDAAGALASRYIEKFPEGDQLETVAELNASLLVQLGKFDEAAAFLGSYLEKHPDSPSRQKFRTLLANSRFQDGQYDQAAADYDELIKEFADSPELEDYVYRRALCDFFRNDYESTVKSFEAYEKAYPEGTFAADVRYRRGIIQLALGEHDALVASMKGLLEDPGASSLRAQIHTLLGDSYQKKGELDAAGTEYKAAVETAGGDANILLYALDQATNLLRGARRWDDLESLWKDFLAKNPDSPMALRGVSELSKLLIRADKKEEARTMLASHILKDIQNPRSEYVEMLVSQLAGMHVPPRTVKKDAPKPDVEAIEAALVEDLEVPQENRTPAYVARVLFAKSELARMMRDPDRSALNLGAIAGSASPADLGPLLLSIVGQHLFDKGDYDKAVPIYERLRDAFPDSPFSGAAPVGLGRIALAQKQYDEAIKNFDAALAVASSDESLKQATFGKGQALRMLKRRDEAKKLFEEVVAARNWRGLEKAGALYELGEIESEAGDRGAAHAYFQRVYLSHGAYPEFVKKSYQRAADMLRSVGKHDEARATLRELIRKFPDSEEAAKARTIVTD